MLSIYLDSFWDNPRFAIGLMNAILKYLDISSVIEIIIKILKQVRNRNIRLNNYSVMICLRNTYIFRKKTLSWIESSMRFYFKYVADCMNKLRDHALSFNISLKKRKFSGTQVQYSMSYEGLIPQQHYQNFQRANEIFRCSIR